MYPTKNDIEKLERNPSILWEIAFAEDRRESHLSRTDSRIETFYEKRTDRWSSNSRKESLASGLDLDEHWRNSKALERQNTQQKVYKNGSLHLKVFQKDTDLKDKKVNLDVEDPVKRPIKKFNVLMLITFILFLITAGYIGVSQALKQKPNDTNSPSGDNIGLEIGSPPSLSPSPQAAAEDSSGVISADETASTLKVPAIAEESLTDLPIKGEFPIEDIPPSEPVPSASAPPPVPLPPVRSQSPPPASPQSPPTLQRTFRQHDPPALPPQPQPRQAAESFTSQSFSDNILQNADFSRNPCIGKPFCYSKDSSSIYPWRLTSGKEFEINSPGRFSFAPNSYTLDLNASENQNSAYTITQTISTVRGARYKLSFTLTVNPCSTESSRTGFVEADGNGRQPFTTTRNAVLFEYEFVSNGNNNDVSIGSTSSYWCGPMVFDIRVVRIS